MRYDGLASESRATGEGIVMATQTDEAKRQAEDAAERIRALNEQILSSSKEWGGGFLDAYEQSIQSFADFQERAAAGTDVSALAAIAKAQADFTREITKISADAARRMVS
jgi:hypothetical protein